MALGLLWLSLAILVVLQTQARDSTPDLIPAPPLLRVPVYPDFRNEQFQGKWYIIGYAGNGFKKEKHSKLKRYTVTYELNNDDSYNVTSIAPRDQRCENWTKISTQNFRLSQFNLHNIEGNTGMSSYTARVVTTDYDQFAILHFRKVYNNQEYIKVNLYVLISHLGHR
ncbi:neutrophil gelatinase-associated lipocalin-like isoform X2 [Suricata suricatta]|uniref:neutrophil gelatinase-associated lipocalin-like isoform X2 n=1 Tax=Suricata suricatta TaxID=37032 RepID=UPI0011552BE6|nr:neutrophil gelatinase-associated lipocalin-like isoform X2 [Suricata suricatta]